MENLIKQIVRILKKKSTLLVAAPITLAACEYKAIEEDKKKKEEQKQKQEGKKPITNFNFNAVRVTKGLEAVSSKYQRITVLQDKMYSVGGQNASNLSNDVWSSYDGAEWEKLTQTVSFTPRVRQELITFNQQMWVIGGSNIRGSLNDVWSSYDGKRWVQVKKNDNTGFSPRSYFATLVFKNQIWVIGGAAVGGSDLNDVWSSYDGQNWIQAKKNDNTGFKARYQTYSVVYQDKMWIIGGTNFNGKVNDVWSSYDGKNWEKVIEKAKFTGAGSNGAIILNYGQRMWLLGHDFEGKDVWTSTDSKNWIQQKMILPSGGSFLYQRGVVFKDKIFTIGNGRVLSYQL